MLDEPLVKVVLVAMVAGGATGLGALPIFFTDRVSHRVYDGALGLAAGIMFGASMFSLILPGMELGDMWEVMVGILLGGLFLLGTNQLIPHLHLDFSNPEGAEFKKKALLIGSAITIHNFPEGLAVGIAFGSGFEGVALALAVAIGIQNVPDGFAMSIPASKTELSKSKNLLYTTLSGGIPEPVAAALGFTLVTVFTQIFPVAAGFAAGAMMAVIFREIIPSSHSHGHANFSTMTFVAGFVLMMFIDNAFAV
jgi:ZIP family zinc transporter